MTGVPGKQCRPCYASRSLNSSRNKFEITSDCFENRSEREEEEDEEGKKRQAEKKSSRLANIKHR